MLLKSEAYKACIDYFVDNIDVFENNEASPNAPLIADLVVESTADMLMAFCEQQVHIDQIVRNEVIAEGDKLIEELEHILGRLWENPATTEQIAFLEEYFLLLKNSLDSQV